MISQRDLKMKIDVYIFLIHCLSLVLFFLYLISIQKVFALYLLKIRKPGP